MKTTIRQLVRLITVLVGLWLILALCGCQARETNKALQQSDQAQEAAQRVLAEKIAPRIAALPVDVQAEVKTAMDQVCQLLASGRASIRPALTLTAGNEPPPTVDTTVEEAVSRPQEFIRKASAQVGRAEVEVERIGGWLATGAFVLKWGEAIAGDLMSQLLLLLGGSTGAGAAGLAVFRLWRQAKVAKQAVEDAVSFGNEAASVDPKDSQAKSDLVKRHKARQKNHGTRSLIDSVGAAVTLDTKKDTSV